MKKFAFLGCIGLLWTPLRADTLIFNDGRQLEGSIVTETEDAYTVLLQVTETIRDERKISKSEIREVIKQTPAEQAFEAIKPLTPTPDLLGKDDYDQRIAKVKQFLERFPESADAPLASDILQTLVSEREILAVGGIKFRDEMLTGMERDAAAYTLDSEIAASAVRTAAAANRRIDALRAWEWLESEYSSSQAYRRTLPVILQVMRRQLEAVERILESFDERIESRDRNLQRVPRKDRARAASEIEREAAEYQQRVAAEKEQGIRWVSLDPYQEDTLKDAKRQLETDLQQLQRLDVTELPDGDEVWAEAWKAMNNEPTATEATAIIQDAKKAKLPEKYLEKLEALAP